MAAKKLSHVSDSGEAVIVDIGGKDITERRAVARGEVKMLPETLALIKDGLIKKGDVLTVARIAGITGAKRTSELIPLCHPLQLSFIQVDIDLDDDLPGLVIRSEVKSAGRTGVEMEALTAVSVAALTVYDMSKSAEKSIKIQNIQLVKKSGGKSGEYQLDEKARQ